MKKKVSYRKGSEENKNLGGYNNRLILFSIILLSRLLNEICLQKYCVFFFSKNHLKCHNTLYNNRILILFGVVRLFQKKIFLYVPFVSNVCLYIFSNNLEILKKQIRVRLWLPHCFIWAVVYLFISDLLDLDSFTKATTLIISVWVSPKQVWSWD